MKTELEQVLSRRNRKAQLRDNFGRTGRQKIEEKYAPIIKRVIHTTADFDYADNLVFSAGVLEQALSALQSGACIVTDTQMAKAGINKKALGKAGS